ncbi:MAG: ABC transporter ATP-binding protein [Lachnospiraceae bacterium]|nr:ABC transporter ATP-binding protein [Lachnospiraceae bacterium]
MGAIIEIRDMCKIYNPGENEVRALDHVTLDIGENEFVAIIGQSGSGKSTLMNMLGCLDVPTSGTYLLHGTDVSELLDDELSDIRNREIGFIFQGFNLIANLTALENVELPLIYRGVPKGKRRELALTALAKVGLENRVDHKPSEMSGGQQQRVAIARAIAQAPPIILADEPTGNLDSRSSEEIMGILHELHEEGRTVILITHDNSIAAKARRVVSIRDGQIYKDEINELYDISAANATGDRSFTGNTQENEPVKETESGIDLHIREDGNDGE